MSIVYPRPSAFLMEMPAEVLYGDATVIERWLVKHGKMRPTLLDLCAAREARRSR